MNGILFWIQLDAEEGGELAGWIEERLAQIRTIFPTDDNLYGVGEALREFADELQEEIDERIPELDGLSANIVQDAIENLYDWTGIASHLLNEYDRRQKAA